MIILKVTKNEGFILSIEDTKNHKDGGGGSNWPPSRFRVKEPSVLSTFVMLNTILDDKKGEGCRQIFTRVRGVDKTRKSPTMKHQSLIHKTV